MELNKNTIALIGILGLIVLQCVAWLCGYNGQVFAFTSSMISLIFGSLFGFTVGLKRGGNGGV